MQKLNIYLISGIEADWGEQSIESLPGLFTSASTAQNYPNLYGAKSLDNLASTLNFSNSQTFTPQPDPFDTSQFWGTNQQTTPRPNYQQFDSEDRRQTYQESPRYSSNNHSASTSANSSHIYNNTPSTSNNSYQNNSPYGAMASSNYARANALSLERNAVPSIAATLGQMSLDDRISESLNLRTKSNNSDHVYAENAYNAPSTSTADSVNDDNNYRDIPLYKNFDINPAQQQFILETKDYYTKLSTPTKTYIENDYEKNIYIPKYEEEGSKLQNFSERVENSKNYSALKYQNIDMNQYSNYEVSYGANVASTSRDGVYDEVNDTASNMYSEIGDGGVYGRPLYSNANLYDEVTDDTPRPHRPAPPCPKPN